MWTLTQTDDTLWYHVYKTQGTQEGRAIEGKAGVSLRKDSFTGALKEEEEGEEQPVTPRRDPEEETLRQYFQLDVKLGDLYEEWGAADAHFKRVSQVFTGQCVYLLARSPSHPLLMLLTTSIYESLPSAAI